MNRIRNSRWGRMLFFLASLAVGIGTVQAEKADREKPTTIDADRLSHDDQKQITTFSGNVVLTKGTLILRGDRMELWQDSAGHTFGKPARFRQKRDGVNEFMEGESGRLDYNGKDEIVTLSQNALLRRLEGDLLKDQVAGDALTYNNITEQYQVESNQGQPRSRMTLMPGKR
jgi:lipopolysaccharide export system protein LptA